MRLLVTGASGWIGSAVVPELLAAGHDVVGLARSALSAAAIEGAGARAVAGDLDDPGSLVAAARGVDGVVHLAFQHDVAFGAGDFATAAAVDRRAVEVMGAALAGTDGPFVLASGMVGLGAGRLGTEDDGLVAGPEVRALPPGRRHATALLALSLWGLGVRSSVVRFAPTVHGDGDGGFVATFVGVARATGVSAYVGEGANRWPAVHVADAARLVRLAVEGAPPGSVLHAAAENVPFRSIAESIGRQLEVPAAGVAAEAAGAHFGPLGAFAGLDMPVTSARTQELVGWRPTGPTLLDDLDAGRYTR